LDKRDFKAGKNIQIQTIIDFFNCIGKIIISIQNMITKKAVDNFINFLQTAFLYFKFVLVVFCKTEAGNKSVHKMLVH